MSQFKRILIESEAAFHFAKGQYPGSEIDWWTTSPWLLDRLPRSGEKVFSLEESIPSWKMNWLGEVSLDFSQFLADTVASAWDDEGEKNLLQAMRSTLHRTFFALAYKAHLLAVWLAKTEREKESIIVGTPEPAMPKNLSPSLDRFVTLYAVLGGRMEARENVSVLPFRCPNDGSDNISKMRNVGQSNFERLMLLLNVNLGALSFRVFTKFLKSKFSGFPWSPKRNIRILIGKRCELLEETVLPLALRGATIGCLPPFPATGKTGGMEQPFDRSGVEARSTEFLQGRFEKEGFVFGPEQKAALAVLLDLLGQSLRYADESIRAVRKYIEILAQDTGNSKQVIITNGFSSPLEQLAFHCLDQFAIPVIALEHGLHEGMSKSSLNSRSSCTTLNSHSMVCLTQCALDHFVREGVDNKAVVAGNPHIIKKVRMKGLQRFLSRKYLHLDSTDKIYMYVTMSNRNNLIMGPYCQNDFEQYTTVSTVQRLLSESGRKFLLKLYPSNRYVDPEPYLAYGSETEQSNVIQYLEFRYIRAVADVFIMDSSQSVLSWAWGMDIPIIFLDLPSDPLLPEVREAFDAALFRIDCRKDTWQDEMMHLLNLPYAELDERWRSKAAARKKVREKFIMGPDGCSGTRAAKFIIEQAEQWQRSN